ncbi:MAG: DUF4040 domain-containing protein [Spirochaetia bacterium]|jgi:uncharacterized MnhB-related membrane protein|nr:DUF4040 domain-containing protein [Spirochaetia bacterium]
MTELILVAILVLSVACLVLKDLVAAIVCLSAISLFSVVLLLRVGAPDVAITEAAVGAGVSTLIYMWAIRVMGRRKIR